MHTKTETDRFVETLLGVRSVFTQHSAAAGWVRVCLTFSFLFCMRTYWLLSSFQEEPRAPTESLKESTFFPDEKLLSYDAGQFKLQRGVYSVKAACHGVLRLVFVSVDVCKDEVTCCSPHTGLDSASQPDNASSHTASVTITPVRNIQKPHTQYKFTRKVALFLEKSCSKCLGSYCSSVIVRNLMSLVVLGHFFYYRAK